MLFRQIFDPKLAQYAYLIGCQATKEALIIDPERDIDQYVQLAEEEGLNIADSTVRGIVVAGEPGGNIPAIRRQIETAFGARVFDHWGMTEIGSLAVESVEYTDGLYLLETECIAEIINPGSGAAVEPGATGELVITNLGRWGSPVIRYRTGDLVQEDLSESPDGLCLKRLKGGVLGRVDDMMTIRGNNVFPSSIDAILREFDEVVEYRREEMAARAS